MPDINETIKAPGLEAGNMIGGHATSAKTLLSEKDVIVHTMPKRFIGLQSSAQKAKGIGLIVLISGLLVLAAALAFLYFYLARQDTSAPIVTPVEPVTVIGKNADKPLVKEPDTAPAAEAEKPAGEIPAENPNLEPLPVESTSSPEITDIGSTTVATTSEIEAASSTKVIEAPATSTPPAAITASDSDGDGLTDLEEVLFDCNINAADSDGDGFSDLSEMMNFYNPAGAGSLIVNPNIEKYINSAYDYALYYPYLWPVADLGSDDTIMFALGNNQFIQVIVQPNTEKKSLDDWYMSELGLTAVPEQARMYKKGWYALKSDDGLNIYLAKPDNGNFFVVSYNLGLTNALQYQNIFALMVKSLEIEN